MRLIEWMILELELRSGETPYPHGDHWKASTAPAYQHEVFWYQPILQNKRVGAELGLRHHIEQPHLRIPYRCLTAADGTKSFLDGPSLMYFLTRPDRFIVHGAKPIREVQCKCGAALNYSCHGMSGHAHCSDGRRATQVDLSVERCTSSVQVPVYRAPWGELFIEDHDSTALSAI
jgi:hypothetical protein